MALRLDPQLHQALTSRAASQQTSHGELVLTAIEQAHADGHILNQPRNADSGGLFPRLRARKSAQPTVLAEIRLHRRAVSTIDNLVTEYSFASRTELITAALRWYLLEHTSRLP